MYDIDNIKKDLKNNLSEFRYNHSIMVAEEARNLARHYNINEDKAYVAGLVHDVSKEFSPEDNERIISTFKLSSDLLDCKYKKIIHADIGACVCKEKYGLDSDICEAVKYHTIGNVSMSLFDKIIFIADKIGRKDVNDEIIQLKKLAYQDINKAMLFFIKNERQYLNSMGKEIHHNTIELLNVLS